MLAMVVAVVVVQTSEAVPCSNIQQQQHPLVLWVGLEVAECSVLDCPHTQHTSPFLLPLPPPLAPQTNHHHHHHHHYRSPMTSAT